MKVTRQHNEDCKTLLKLMGVPYVDVSLLMGVPYVDASLLMGVPSAQVLELTSIYLLFVYT